MGQLTRDRHAKHGDTIYHLEPNIKEAPGGVRDLHLIGWLSQLGGIEPENSREELSEAQRFLFSVRCHLRRFRVTSCIITFGSPALWTSFPSPLRSSPPVPMSFPRSVPSFPHADNSCPRGDPLIHRDGPSFPHDDRSFPRADTSFPSVPATYRAVPATI
ncbi:MAG: hypothetical protein ACREWG_09340 [Gammaproteobacteria bacterium]